METINLSELFDPAAGTMDDGDRAVGLQALQEQMKAGRLLTDREICLLMLNLGHADFRVREECLFTLDDCSRATGRIAALALLLDEECLIRDHALEILEFCGEAQDQYAVERILETEEEWTVRASTVSCLAGIAGEQAKPAIIKTLRDSDPDVRRYAADALARVGNTEDMAVLLKAEADEEETEAKIGIYSALYRLGDAASFHKLLDIVSGDSPGADYQMLVLGALNDYLFPDDFDQVKSYLNGLDLEKAHPEVRERARKLQKRVNAPPT